MVNGTFKLRGVGGGKETASVGALWNTNCEWKSNTYTYLHILEYGLTIPTYSYIIVPFYVASCLPYYE